MKRAHKAIAHFARRLFSAGKNPANPRAHSLGGLLCTQAEIAGLIERLAPHARIGLDTEADSLHCYREKLCLIQIGLPGEDLLVDPLCGIDLAPLFRSLEKREVILHGADYDLRLFNRAGHTNTTRIFDTMIAARLTGLKEFSYSALVEKFFEVKLTKASQKANWALRPLSAAMEQYARNDTRYLLPLAEKLEAQLEKMERREWLAQSCQRAIAAAKIVRERDEENAWRISGSAKLDGRASAILRALWQWREAEASAVDRPSFHILRNEELLESAVRFHRGDRVYLRHLHGPRAKRFFAAAERALQLDASQWPVRPRGVRMRFTPAQEKKIAELKKRRDHIAAKIELDPALIASRATIEQLAFDGANIAEILLPWQRELLGL